jgi:hypothetical protein
MGKPYLPFLSVAVFFFFLLLLIGCKANEHVSKHLPWVESWLSNPICDPPCWECIIPGVTTIGEGQEIASQLSGVENVGGPYRIHNGKSIGIRMKGCEGNSFIMLFDNKIEDGTIDLISLSPGCSEDNTTVKLLNSAYGDPDYTWVYWIEPGCRRIYLNLENGMLITGYKEQSFLFSRVDPEILVSYIGLFQPVEDLKTFLESEGYSGVNVFPWVSIDDDPCLQQSP